MKMRKSLWTFGVICFFMFSIGCAPIPVRESVQVPLTLPLGKIEGNQFTGIRYPFKVSAPANWVIATEYPEFLLDLGFDKEGLEESQIFIYNPATQSNLQIDFTPAGRYAKFDQKNIEVVAALGMSGFESEVQDTYGKDVKVQVSPPEVFSLKGAPFSAKEYATYSVKGEKREQGIICSFAEPYQIFITYMILEKPGMNDRQDLKTILDSFQIIAPASNGGKGS